MEIPSKLTNLCKSVFSSLEEEGMIFPNKEIAPITATINGEPYIVAYVCTSQDGSITESMALELRDAIINRYNEGSL